MREPMLWPAGALAAGIATAHCAKLGAAEAFGAACAFGVLAAVSRRFSGAWLWRLCSLLAVAAAGAGLAGLHEGRPEPVIDAGPRETVVVAGCVAEPPALLPGRYEFVAELAPGARAVVRVYQDESEAWPELRYGQRVDITGRIRRPRNFLNPGAFDYRRSLERREIYWIISVSRPGDLEPLSGECGSRFWKLVYGARQAALQRLHRVFRDHPRTANLLGAALLGDSAALGEIWKERFRETGTYHTLVVSGLHLTILAGLVHLLLRLLGFSRGWKTVAASALAWAYALLTGGRLPVLRAAGGLTLFLIGSWCFRRPRLLNLLAVVAMFIIPDGRGEKLLDWKTAATIPWGILLLFGGGICLAKAFDVSGLSTALAGHLTELSTLPVVLMIFVIALGVTFLTETTSNTASTVLLMPVLAAAALGSNIDPKILMVPATISASCAFMMPVATAPNSIIYGSGYLTTSKMASEGFVLNLLGAGVITGLCYLILG